jgi:hypothetical protein
MFFCKPVLFSVFFMILSSGCGGLSSYKDDAGQVCDEDDLGLAGATYGSGPFDSVDVGSPLADDGENSLMVAGEITSTEDRHWYRITTADDVVADVENGRDEYNFQVAIVLGEDSYRMTVYRNDYVPSAAECGGQEGYTQYSDFWIDTEHTELLDAKQCGGPDSKLNHCQDMSATYYIEVFRINMNGVCPFYSLEFANGDVELVTVPEDDS